MVVVLMSPKKENTMSQTATVTRYTTAPARYDWGFTKYVARVGEIQKGGADPVAIREVRIDAGRQEEQIARYSSGLYPVWPHMDSLKDEAEANDSVWLYGERYPVKVVCPQCEHGTFEVERVNDAYTLICYDCLERIVIS